jgi:hypothetical protein
MDQETELAHLHKAEADITSAKARISRQEEIVARLKNHGQDASIAASLLLTMRDTLKVMEEHRELILEQLAAMKCPM